MPPSVQLFEITVLVGRALTNSPLPPPPPPPPPPLPPCWASGKATASRAADLGSWVPFLPSLWFLFRAESYLILSYLSRSLADRWGTTVDFTTSFLHSSRFSAFRSMIFHSRPVHSLMLSSHRFFCLPMGRQDQRVESYQ